jgi:hypothetical protein
MYGGISDFLVPYDEIVLHSFHQRDANNLAIPRKITHSEAYHEGRRARRHVFPDSDEDSVTVLTGDSTDQSTAYVL